MYATLPTPCMHAAEHAACNNNTHFIDTTTTTTTTPMSVRMYVYLSFTLNAFDSQWANANANANGAFLIQLCQRNTMATNAHSILPDSQCYCKSQFHNFTPSHEATLSVTSGCCTCCRSVRCSAMGTVDKIRCCSNAFHPFQTVVPPLCLPVSWLLQNQPSQLLQLVAHTSYSFSFSFSWWSWSTLSVLRWQGTVGARVYNTGSVKSVWQMLILSVKCVWQMLILCLYCTSIHKYTGIGVDVVTE